MMKNVKIRKYTAHEDYNIEVDADFLNMRIRIYGEDFEQTGKVDYEGSIGKFLKERIPADWLAELLPELRTIDKLSYKTSGGESFIEKLK
jgi:hypothetical protein